MSNLKWFVQVNNKVNGPYSEAEVTKVCESKKDHIIWGKGLTEWISYSDWKEFIKNKTNELIQYKNSPTWRYKINLIESQLLSFDDLISALKKIKDYELVYIKSNDESKWLSVFSFSTVADELGITRRSSPRVPVLGFFEGSRLDNHNPLKAKIVTISEGGCGVADGKDFTMGTSLKGSILSPNLPQTIHFQGDVVYVGKDGYIGIKFSAITAEAKSQIIDYVKKFSIS